MAKDTARTTGTKDTAATVKEGYAAAGSYVGKTTNSTNLIRSAPSYTIVYYGAKDSVPTTILYGKEFDRRMATQRANERMASWVKK